MKKISLYCVALCLLSIAVSAQNRSRVFDNFDTTKGVEIVSPTVTPITKANENPTKKANDKKLIKKTSQMTSVQDSVKLRKEGYLISVNFGLGGFTTGNSAFDSYILEACAKYNIDPLLIYAQMHQESAFKLKATSHKGASGLMQLMPATARRFGVTKIYDPQQNIHAGVRYMRWLLDKFDGDMVLALAGYNAGEGAVMKYGNRVPPYRETQEYVRRITGRYSSIINPNIVKKAVKVSDDQAAKLEQDEKIESLKTYELNVLTVRLPDGRMRLVNQ